MERLPEPPAPHRRTGWLLRSNRMLHPDPRVRTLTGMAALLAPGLTVSPCTVSRWETGVVSVGYRTIQQYERVLGLRPYLLVAVADSMYRYWSTRLTSSPALRRPAAFRRTDIDAVIERAGTAAEMSGADWDRLTYAIVTWPDVALSRIRWARLADRLLTELRIADGMHWHCRYEAFSRLMAHPQGQLAAIEACVAATGDPRNQMGIETVSALDASGNPAAAAAVLDQLENPANDATQVGALLACVRKLRCGHFGSAQRRRIAGALSELRNDDRFTDQVALAGAVLRETGRPGIAPVQMEARYAIADRQRRGIVVRRVVNAARGALPAMPESFEDDMLPRLVAEMLFALSSGTRLCAASLIAASPYRAGVAGVVAAELAAHGLAARQVEWAQVLLDALRVIGGASERRLVEHLALVPEVPRELAAAAAFSIGHLRGTTDPGFWLSAVCGHARERGRTPGRAAVAAGLVYGAGTSNAVAALQVMRNSAALPARARAAAGWWLDLPAEIVASAGL